MFRLVANSAAQIDADRQRGLLPALQVALSVGSWRPSQPALVGLGLDAFLQAKHVTGEVKRAADEDALGPRLVGIGALQRRRDIGGTFRLEPDFAGRLGERLWRVRRLVRPGDGHG